MGVPWAARPSEGTVLRLRLCLRKQYRDCRDHDHSPLVEHRVANGEWSNNPDPDLAGLLSQVSEWVAELRIRPQSPIKFPQRCDKGLTVPALASFVRQD